MKITNPSHFRENVGKRIHEIVQNEDESMHVNIEKSVFNYALKEASRHKIVKKWENPQFVSIYVDRLRSLVLNLKKAGFLEQVKNGEFEPKQLAFLTHQEFEPEQWRLLIEKKMKRDASKYNDNIQASTNMYTCKKCKSTRCTYYEMQTRSADEPATIFVTCLDCGKHWRS